MQIWAESGKSALPICNYSQILYQFLTFTQNLKRSRQGFAHISAPKSLKNRNDVIRTRDLFVPNEALYQAEPHSDMLLIDESIDYVSLQRYLV